MEPVRILTGEKLVGIMDEAVRIAARAGLGRKCVSVEIIETACARRAPREPCEPRAPREPREQREQREPIAGMLVGIQTTCHPSHRLQSANS